MQLTVLELLDAVGGTLLYGNKTDTFRYVSTDSREQMTTQLFIPLVGENQDGHRYIASAVENGAVGFLTQNETAPQGAVFAVNVKDTTKALGDLAAYVLGKSGATVIGITGSVGKTTTRQFVAAVVSTLGKTVATSGNFNNHIGLPLTILKMEGDEQYAVLEMGMNHPGEISYLSKIAKPNYGIITMVGTSHIEYLGSRENILLAKMEIEDGMKQDGVLLLNGDNDLLSQVTARHKTVYFGKEKAEYPYEILSEQEPASFTLDSACYQIPTSGAHNIQNASAAVLLGKLLGASAEQIQAGLSDFETVGFRQKTEQCGSITLIADCYNASLDSDRAALRVLKQTNCSRTVAVLGPIGELGDHLPAILQEVGSSVVENQIDLLICVEQDAHWIKKGAMRAGMPEDAICYYETKEQFINDIPRLFQPGDAVLLKASRMYRFEELFEQVKQYQLQNKE